MRDIHKVVRTFILCLLLAACASSAGMQEDVQAKTAQQQNLLTEVFSPLSFMKYNLCLDRSYSLSSKLTFKFLKGLTPVEITKYFGEPVFKRQEFPAEIWRYESKLCSLFVFMYKEKKLARVDYIENRNRSIHYISKQQCIDTMLSLKETGPRNSIF
ncbi:MAG: hypothetical protein KAJ75_01105 [Alphaproteobacteria bacterium]|nr:hypothetical protein [Alphaproteobacteria bacterium]